MDSYKCTVCGYVYSPTMGDPFGGIEPGTRLEDLSVVWTCPICMASKEMFEKESKFYFRDQSQDSMPLNLLAIEENDKDSIYKKRFENLFRVVRKVTSSI